MTAMDQKKYERAKKRVHDEKGFYAHLAIYIVINIFILIMNIRHINLDISDWGFWSIFITPVLWGIGLFFHWMKVFDKNPFFSKDWEERKINEILKEEEDFLQE